MSVVKLRRNRSGSGGFLTTLTVPRDLADSLAAVGVEAFTVALVEEGILLRPVTVVDAPEETLPAWLTPRAESPESPPNARRATRTDKARTATDARTINMGEITSTNGSQSPKEEVHAG